jgi:hypothetical protein
MYLKGFLTAVAHADRELAKRLASAIDRKPAITRHEVKPGEIVGDKYAVNLSIDAAKAILDCLVKIEKTHAYNSKFGGFQINFLVPLWREFLKQLESSKTPKLPTPE